MTDNKQHIKNLKKLKSFHNGSYGADIDRSIKALEQEDILDKIRAEIMSKDGLEEALEIIDKYNAESEQEPKTGQYEYHIDHTDCIWYGSDSGCPVTCSQYRDGWNDAMDYIFKNGKGYKPYRRDG